jgi:hypothetical protein
MLAKAQLIVDILDAFDSVSNNPNIDPAAARTTIAQKLANAIDTFVKTGTVNVTVTVATTGSATAQAGTGTGVGTVS